MMLTKIFVLSIVGLFIVFPSYAQDCWQKEAAKPSLESWRLDDKYNYSFLKGDFNHDGLEDKVEFRFSCNQKKVGLFIFLKRKNSQSYKTRKLTIIAAKQFPAYGIKLMASGVHPRICNSCDKPNQSVRITTPTIKLFKYEGVESIFVWDKARSKFQQIWISD